jgi:hypothetical protein
MLTRQADGGTSYEAPVAALQQQLETAEEWLKNAATGAAHGGLDQVYVGRPRI